MMEAFCADPEGSPLKTPSGKIELYSEVVAGFGYADCPGHATWNVPDEWAGDASGEFPLHLLGKQPTNKLHSQLDPGAWAKAAKVNGREAVEISPQDAAARGIADGDIVEAALKTVHDPEIPVNIYDLGLIYDVDRKDGGDVYITMSLTAP